MIPLDAQEFFSERALQRALVCRLKTLEFMFPRKRLEMFRSNTDGTEYAWVTHLTETAVQNLNFNNSPYPGYKVVNAHLVGFVRPPLEPR